MSPQVDLPEYMRRIKFASRLTQQGPGHYRVAAALRRAERVLLQVAGPVRVAFSPEVSFTTNVTLTTLASGSHRMSAYVTFSPSTNIMFFELKNEQTPVFSLEWNMVVHPQRKNTITFKMLLLPVTDCSIEVVVGERAFDVILDSLLFLDSSSPRRVKSFTSVDLEHRTVKADLSWDADRDAGKTVALEGQLLTSPARPGHASIP